MRHYGCQLLSILLLFALTASKPASRYPEDFRWIDVLRGESSHSHQLYKISMYLGQIQGWHPQILRRTYDRMDTIVSRPDIFLAGSLHYYNFDHAQPYCWTMEMRSNYAWPLPREGDCNAIDLLSHEVLPSQWPQLRQNPSKTALDEASGFWQWDLRDIFQAVRDNFDVRIPGMESSRWWIFSQSPYWYEVQIRNRPRELSSMFARPYDDNPCTFEIKLGQSELKSTGRILGTCEGGKEQQDIVYTEGKIFDRRPVWMQRMLSGFAKSSP